MSPTPEVQPLPQKHRRFVFLTALFVFCITVPLFVFYAIGYRFDFTDDIGNIKSVGGMYISAKVHDIQIYVDDQPVQNMRIFQNATYIQNLQAGMHQIHTQGSGVQTWVKELPVFPHFVTEAQSFNMPKVPQVRFITAYSNEEGLPVIFASSTILTFASSTPLTFASSSATSTLTKNPEYAYVQSLFASSSELAMRIQKQKKSFVFQEKATSSADSVEATTTKTYRSTRLYEQDGEVYIQWEGKDNAKPYYYCVRYEGTSTISALYGESVGKNMEAQVLLADVLATDTESSQENFCRKRIRIGHKESDIQWFDYMPGSRDFVLLQLDDGVYVVEVDDRAWQNMQLLYPGTHMQVLVDGSKILIYDKDAKQYLEVFTELL